MLRSILNGGGNMYRVSTGRPPVLPRFDPVVHGLAPDFVLTKFTKMKG